MGKARNFMRIVLLFLVSTFIRIRHGLIVSMAVFLTVVLPFGIMLAGAEYWIRLSQAEQSRANRTRKPAVRRVRRMIRPARQSITLRECREMSTTILLATFL